MKSFCVKCRTFYECVKQGICVKLDRFGLYQNGDIYECECKHQIITTKGKPFVVSSFLEEDDKFCFPIKLKQQTLENILSVN